MGIVTLPFWKCSLKERSISKTAHPERSGIAMQFTRVDSPVEDMEIWNGSSDRFSFVISYESCSGPGFHGRTGFLASWRPNHLNRSAIRVGGSPFKTLAEAEDACKATLILLPKAGVVVDNEAHVDFDARSILRKWPSLRNERRTNGASPYLLVDGTLEECIREFMAKSASVRPCTKLRRRSRP